MQYGVIEGSAFVQKRNTEKSSVKGHHGATGCLPGSNTSFGSSVDVVCEMVTYWIFWNIHTCSMSPYIFYDTYPLWVTDKLERILKHKFKNGLSFASSMKMCLVFLWKRKSSSANCHSSTGEIGQVSLIERSFSMTAPLDHQNWLPINIWPRTLTTITDH